MAQHSLMPTDVPNLRDTLRYWVQSVISARTLMVGAILFPLLTLSLSTFISMMVQLLVILQN